MKNTTKYSFTAYTADGKGYPVLLASSLLSYEQIADTAEILLRDSEIAVRIKVVNLDNGEVVVDLSRDDDDDEPSDDDLEMGFNPYLGGYDFDC